MPFKEIDATVLNSDLVITQNLVTQNCTTATLTVGPQTAGASDVMAAGGGGAFVVVNSSAVTAGSVIQLTHAGENGTLGNLAVTTIVPNTSFVISSDNVLDLNPVYWTILSV